MPSNTGRSPFPVDRRRRSSRGSDQHHPDPTIGAAVTAATTTPPAINFNYHPGAAAAAATARAAATTSTGGGGGGRMSFGSGSGTTPAPYQFSLGGSARHLNLMGSSSSGAGGGAAATATSGGGGGGGVVGDAGSVMSLTSPTASSVAMDGGSSSSSAAYEAWIRRDNSSGSIGGGAAGGGTNIASKGGGTTTTGTKFRGSSHGGASVRRNVGGGGGGKATRTSGATAAAAAAAPGDVPNGGGKGHHHGGVGPNKANGGTIPKRATSASVSEVGDNDDDGDAKEDRRMAQLRSLVRSSLLQPPTSLTSSASSSAAANAAVGGPASLPPATPASLSTAPSSTSAAVCYGEVLYTRTRLPGDAYLYARALTLNGEHRRAAMLLDSAGLLSFDGGGGDRDEHNLEGGDAVETAGSPPSPSPELVVESVLLASHGMASCGEWEEASALLERACRLPTNDDDDGPARSDRFEFDGYDDHHGDGEVIGDGDDPRLLLLARAVRPQVGPNGGRDADDPRNDGVGALGGGGGVHPVARLCAARGRAYDELGNAGRAAGWLRASLRLDPRCVEALDHLLNRHLLTADEERELVHSLEFDEDSAWLRDLYIARLSSSGGGGGTASGPELGSMRGAEHELATASSNTPLFRHDASSIATDSSSPGLRFVNAANSSSIHAQHTPSVHFMPSPMDTHPSSAFRDPAHRGGRGGSAAAGSSSFRDSARKAPSNGDDAAVDGAFLRLAGEHRLGQSADVLALAANRAYYSHRLPLAASLCAAAYRIDPLCPRVLMVHIVTLVGLRRKRELFYLAHQLVDANPKTASAWFAVGCYYQLCGKYDVAQRHFCRATRLEPKCAEAWVAFGCSFASADESDQALAAYRAAQRLHPGSHYPLLYMGMEYLRTNHLSLAGYFLGSASRMKSEDPLSFNELGVCAYRQGRYADAVQLFLHALRLCAGLEMNMSILAEIAPGGNDFGRMADGDAKLNASNLTADLSDAECIVKCRDVFWEPTIFNLGQCYRKIRRFEEAIVCFEAALGLCPGTAATYTALGYTKHLTGDLDGAIESYHQALGIKPDETFSGELLNRALEEAFSNPISQQSLPTPGTTAHSAKSGTSRFSFGSAYRSHADNSMVTDEGSNFTIDSSDVEMSTTL